MKYILLLSFLLFAISCAQITFETCKSQPEIPMNFGPPEVPYPFLENYTVIELDASTGARCLDGSKYKFYFTKGSGSGLKKFFINWEGGGFCGVDGNDFLDSCLQRSNMFLGSSISWGSNGSIVNSTMGAGYFSSMQEYNPNFWNWNKIYIRYCDGSNHQGYVKDPIDHNGTKLWFRGFNNTFGVLQYARQNLGLFDAEEIIISGGSAGGQATYVWAPFLQDFFPKRIRLMGIADAGLFLDVYNPLAQCNLNRNLNKKVAYYTNSQNLELFEKCPFRKTEIWKCLMTQYNLDRIQVPFFVVNSQNDLEALKTQAGAPCVGVDPKNCSAVEKGVITNYHAKILQLTLQLKNQKRFWGFWLRSCFEHVMQQSWAWYGHQHDVENALNQTKNLQSAVNDWYKKGNIQGNFWSDAKIWSENPRC